MYCELVFGYRLLARPEAHHLELTLVSPLANLFAPVFVDLRVCGAIGAGLTWWRGIVGNSFFQTR